MKTRLFLLALATVMLLPTACKQPTTPVPTAPGYIDSYDQTFAEVIAAASGFYNQIQNNVSAGTYSPSPAEKTALNNFAVALNTFKIAALAYHNHAGTLAAAQTLQNSVQSQQNNLAVQIPQAVK